MSNIKMYELLVLIYNLLELHGVKPEMVAIALDGETYAMVDPEVQDASRK